MSVTCAKLWITLGIVGIRHRKNGLYSCLLSLLTQIMSVNNTKQNTREIGNYGEEIACIYLKKLGYFIQDRNYNKKWGELDIVAVKDNIIHFFEVKSIRTGGNPSYRPEENVHNLKQKRLRRTIQTYLNEIKIGPEPDFRFHVIVVKMNMVTGESDIEMLENIIL